MTRSFRAPRRMALLAVPALGALIGAAAIMAASSTPWPMGGQNLGNTRSTSSGINPDNAKNLALKWTFTTHGDVSATPAVVGGAVYFPDWGGYVNKVNASTGALIWQKPISDYTGKAGQVARTSPAVDGNTVYIGTQNVFNGFVNPPVIMNGGELLAINATTGALKWKKDISLGNSQFAIATQSPVVYNGVVYEGIASAEEGNAAFIPNYPCCSDRGSMSAVSTSGDIVWQRHTTPPGYSGAGVWGSTPAIDPSTNTVYIATGNNYSNCQQGGACDAIDNYVDSVLALDASTGAVKWADKLDPGSDSWNVSCIFPFINPGACPANAGPDYDFGSGPQFFTLGTGSKARKVVGAGQKSGDYWLLDATTGEVLWRTHGGPGSTLGGIEWGSSTDGKRVYIAEANFNRTPFQIADGSTIDYGSWAALDANTGQVLWQTGDPGHGVTIGPTTVANGVVYAGSMTGGMYALDANNGKILWSFQGEGASNAGAAVVDGTVYWGNGYSHLNSPDFQLGAPSNTFYAFSLNGN